MKQAPPHRSLLARSCLSTGPWHFFLFEVLATSLVASTSYNKKKSAIMQQAGSKTANKNLAIQWDIKDQHRNMALQSWIYNRLTFEIIRA
jgi:hypothetical protein